MTGGTGTAPVILLGTDTPIGLAVMRDLGRHGHPVIGIGRTTEALAAKSIYCSHHVMRAEGEDALVAQICELAEHFKAVALLAISEGDLLMLNRQRTRLEAHIPVLTPEADQLALVLDKTLCQEAAAAAGLRPPRSFSFQSIAEARDAAPTLSYPAVLKWADPNIITDRLEAAGLPFLKTEYALTPDDLMDKLGRYAPLGTFPLVQGYAAGHGMGQMFLVRDGETLLEFQHERIHEWPPEGGTSTLCRSVPLADHAALRAQSKALLKSMNWTGVAMVEFRYDPTTGQYCFLEINGRFWGSLPLATAAGVPFAAGLVAACTLDRTPEFRSEYPELTACYWIPESKRLFRLFLQPGHIADPLYKPDRWASLWSYISLPFRPSTRYFVFKASDPGPFLQDMKGVLLKMIRALSRRRKPT